MSFLKFISEKLAEIGLEATETHHDDAVVIGVTLDGYSENITCAVAGKTVDGHSFIRLWSEELPATGDDDIDARLSVLLLRRNPTLNLARWELIGDAEGSAFVVSAVLIANTLDAPELSEAIRSIVGERRRIMKVLQDQSVDF
jgi:hypothetical protein